MDVRFPGAVRFGANPVRARVVAERRVPRVFRRDHRLVDAEIGLDVVADPLAEVDCHPFQWTSASRVPSASVRTRSGLGLLPSGEFRGYFGAITGSSMRKSAW